MLNGGSAVQSEHDCEQVPGQVLRAFLVGVDRTGHEAAPLLKHIPLEPRHLLNLTVRVAWDDLVTLIDRFALDRGQPELNRVAREMVGCVPGLRLLAGLLLPPRAFFRALFSLADRARFWTVSYEESSTRAVVTFELKKSMRGCAAAFEALGEMLGSLPQLLNLPDASVEGRAHSHGARYELELPRGRGLHTRVTDQQLATLVEEFTAATAWGRPRDGNGLPTVAQLEQRFGLTRAEGRVVRRLTAGRSLRDIARELGIGAETVRTHAKRAMQKTDTHRQAELVALVLRMGSREE